MTRGKRRFAGLRDVEVSNPKGVSARVEDRATAKRCWKRRPLRGRSKPLPYGYVHLVGADPLSARCIQPPRDPSLLALCHSRGSKATEESTGRTLEDDAGQEAFCGCT